MIVLFLESYIYIPPISPVEVEEEIQKLAIKKASGCDLITAEVLKELPHPVVIRLSNILNACFHFRYVPTLWKVSDVIMIPKPGKPPNEVTSYRPSGKSAVNIVYRTGPRTLP